MSVSGRSVFTMAFDDYLFDVIFIDTANSENIKALKTLVREQGEQIACFIYEPLLQAAGGMRIYEPDMMTELLQSIHHEGILCVADEVMTGFGRTGTLFASERIRVQPDIICLSKGLTGGTLPLGVTAASQEIFEAFLSDDKGRTFFHGHSFTANPLACTAALASLDLLKKETCIRSIEHIRSANIAFFQKLGERKAVKNPRVIGTVLAFEIISGKDGYLNNISTSITRRSMEAGVYLRPLGNTLYIMPPYCITDDELNKVYRLLDELSREN